MLKLPWEITEADRKMKAIRSVAGAGRELFGNPSLIVAGGAPRDILSDVRIKDIDVFVECEFIEGQTTKFCNGCRALANHYDGVPTFRDSHPDYSNFFSICDIQTASGVIQVIGLDRDPIDDVQNYDFGLSQIFVTPNGCFMTLAAAQDRQNKTITFTPSNLDDKSVARSKKRLASLRERYAPLGWTFVNCEKLDSLP